jgi:DNA-binding CsgD family transcriptional regulator
LVLHRTAKALAATGAHEEATRLLRRAQGTAYTLKAAAMGERIRADLDRLGSRRSSAGPGLSPREAQVMSLVGEGLTSPEIGRQLFLSVRTVDMHVRNSIAKLGCRTRAEAVRRLASQSTVD